MLLIKSSEVPQLRSNHKGRHSTVDWQKHQNTHTRTHIQASNILRTCELLQCSEVHDLYITGKRRRVVEALQREPAAALRQTSRWNWIRVLGSKWSIGSARPFLAGCCYTITTLKTRLCCEHCFGLNCDERLFIFFFLPKAWKHRCITRNECRLWRNLIGSQQMCLSTIMKW